MKYQLIKYEGSFIVYLESMKKICKKYEGKIRIYNNILYFFHVYSYIVCIVESNLKETSYIFECYSIASVQVRLQNIGSVSLSVLLFLSLLSKSLTQISCAMFNVRNWTRTQTQTSCTMFPFFTFYSHTNRLKFYFTLAG
jgi:hypothetical protein